MLYLIATHTKSLSSPKVRELYELSGIIIIIIIIELQYLWNVKTKVIPAITEATGTLSKSFRKQEYMKSRKYKKTAILGTLHVLQKVQLERHKKVFDGKGHYMCHEL